MTQAADAAVADYVWLLYDTSTLSSGFTLAEPTAFSERLYKLVQLGMKGDIHEGGLGSTTSDVDGPTEPTAITAPDVSESAVAVEMEQVD